MQERAIQRAQRKAARCWRRACAYCKACWYEQDEEEKGTGAHCPGEAGVGEHTSDDDAVFESDLNWCVLVCSIWVLPTGE